MRRDRPRDQKSQDATLDLGKRENMIAAARVLCQINGIGTAILRAYDKYTTGTCAPKWSTTNEAWNDDVNLRARLWMSQCHARGQHDYRMLTSLVGKSVIRDGDVFAEKMTEQGFPLIDLIEADRVTDSIAGISNDRDNKGGGQTIGGIDFDSRGRAVAYNVCDRMLWGQFKNPRKILASDILHIFKSDRVDARRGVTHFASALENAFDFAETTDAEKGAQKLRSKIALIVSNSMGRANSNQFTDSGDTDAIGNAVKTEAVDDMLIKYQMNGDKVEALFSNNPSDGWFKMSEMLVRLIAISLELPYEFVWNMVGLTGPGIRLTTKFADRTFQSFMDMMEVKFHYPVWSWWINVEMQEGRIPFNVEWHDFAFTRPIMSSIDAARETTSDVAEMNAGVKSGHDVCKENNRDVYEVQLQLAREAKHRITICGLPEFEGVDPDDIRVNAATLAKIQAEAAEESRKQGGEEAGKKEAA